jgi:23S rRNA (uracil1939-C5)-methyltransferase
MTNPGPHNSDREVVLTHLGGRGDGIARVDGGDVYIPFGLPGERWKLHGQEPAERLSDSPDRMPPDCPHFGVCGGCAMQHAKAETYTAWKRGIVIDALARHGIETQVEALYSVPEGSRRRAVLTGQVQSGHKAVVGFHRTRDHTVVDVRDCIVLRPEIVAALPELRRLTRTLATDGTALRFNVLASLTGLDVSVDGVDRKLPASARAELAGVAENARWARLSIGGEGIVCRRAPELDFGGIRVVPPAGTFVQAVAEAETFMQRCVVAAAIGARHIADLFAGIGTLTFPLSRSARVLAVDSDGAALAALEQAKRHAKAIKPVETRRRDLLREPLARKELEPYDCVVFDPPRAGAKAQAEMLARSKVPVVVAVSCNPATLARDLAILQDGGYVIDRATPIDQFLYSAHVEVVATLKKSRKR